MAVRKDKVKSPVQLSQSTADGARAHLRLISPERLSRQMMRTVNQIFPTTRHYFRGPLGPARMCTQSKCDSIEHRPTALGVPKLLVLSQVGSMANLKVRFKIQ